MAREGSRTFFLRRSPRRRLSAPTGRFAGVGRGVCGVRGSRRDVARARVLGVSEWTLLGRLGPRFLRHLAACWFAVG